MKISVMNKEIYLYINGLGVSERIDLGSNVELLPANVTAKQSTVASLSKDSGEFGLALIFLWQVKSQLHIVSECPKLLAEKSWNSLWDIVLLSALFNCDAVCNFQCDKPAEKILNTCDLLVTNHHLRGISKPTYFLQEEDIKWISENFPKGRNLLDQPRFSHAVHCLATYHWHSLAFAQLALLWSGIEGLFNINSELSFRLSLYISRFLEGDNEERKKLIFKKVKDLYNQRSKAVHGAGDVNNLQESVHDSAQLLRRIIFHCIEQNNLPIIDDLAP
jgi:hypothetical protein